MCFLGVRQLADTNTTSETIDLVPPLLLSSFLIVRSNEPYEGGCAVRSEKGGH